MSPDFERLVGRAILDQEFRDKLIADPDGTIRSSGLSLAPDEIDTVRKSIDRIKQDFTPDQIANPFGATAGGFWK